MAQIDFPQANDLTHFNVTVTPDSGFWLGATYQFSITITSDYPHKPPKVGGLCVGPWGWSSVIGRRRSAALCARARAPLRTRASAHARLSHP